ncbi:pyridoxamine 5'-phosphate oxidase family protein [Fictibacillus fluitans]|uniref:Pyridoxamine 5'-phosphate oxidase family protein n=1 Tax=Fictibacillus fluitans TaxID=3058422 RepID=A0ABT8HRC3_9BACL|nr:pyridoxamine 5'-phosphate oxidase family protein [Fictibacillus sp. NE201]MDN4523299.1 pyridoxamine 5'-phosphate oxidase family protein [Fictibacillus sp. NE201]
MCKLLKISDELLELLNGNNLENKQHEAMLLMTVTEDGWPHNAMVSAGEVVAVDKENLRLALWPGTTTTNNCTRAKKATLVAVYKGTVHYIRLALSPLGVLEDAKHPLERFAAKVEFYKEDQAKYADITSGIQIALKDPSAVVARWKETIEELLR